MSESLLGLVAALGTAMHVDAEFMWAKAKRGHAADHTLRMSANIYLSVV